MMIFTACLLLMATMVTAADENSSSTETVLKHEADIPLGHLSNHGGWVNPEDLPPMPQCIAQQDQSRWLGALTECTHKQCSRHFGVICTHHQWWTQLSCLSQSLSSEVVREYLPFCGRSILAEAQLHLWIRAVTGRDWLVEVGDTIGLRNPSPSSLRKDYSTIGTVDKAPNCLKTSVSALSTESFQHTIASCSFTGTAEHTGNAARPWEYSEHLDSIIALDSETANYGLTLSKIPDGEYFDKDCFCSYFKPDWNSDTCFDAYGADLTQEWLWILATCGPESLPRNQTLALKTTEYDFIKTTSWHWPSCVADIPGTIVDSITQCSSDACELDSDGYCKVTRAIDRACFCDAINYDSCGGTCHIFEKRIDYVNWLQGLCGSVEYWDGLPDNWRQLSSPTNLDMIPPNWPIVSSGNHNSTSTCPSNGQNLGLLVLLNAASFLGLLFKKKADARGIIRKLPWHISRYNWVFTGIVSSALQFLFMCSVAFLAKTTPQYNNVSIFQLVLSWCTVPRITWLPMLFAKDFYGTLSQLAADSITMILSSYYMLSTVHYGIYHNLYFRNLENSPDASSARLMYFGAAIWICVFVMTMMQTLRRIPVAVYRANGFINILTQGFSVNSLFRQHYAEALEAEQRIFNAERQGIPTQKRRLLGEDTTNAPSYGALPPYSIEAHQSSSEIYVEHCVSVSQSMLALWGAQWLFWVGLIGLSSDEYCQPHHEGLLMISVGTILMSLVTAAVR